MVCAREEKGGLYFERTSFREIIFIRGNLEHFMVTVRNVTTNFRLIFSSKKPWNLTLSTCSMKNKRLLHVYERR